MQKLKTSQKLSKASDITITREIRCGRCNLLLCRVKNGSGIIETKCRRCGYLTEYAIDQTKKLVREELVKEVVKEESSEVEEDSDK